MTTTINLTEKDLLATSERLSEPEWVTEGRKRSFETFSALPMPGQKDEKWKYTDFSGLDFSNLSAESVSPFPVVEKLTDYPMGALSQISEEAIHLEQEGGWCKPGIILQHDSLPTFIDLDESIAGKGVIFCSMAEAGTKYSDLVKENIAEF